LFTRTRRLFVDAPDYRRDMPPAIVMRAKHCRQTLNIGTSGTATATLMMPRGTLVSRPQDYASVNMPHDVISARPRRPRHAHVIEAAMTRRLPPRPLVFAAPKAARDDAARRVVGCRLPRLYVATSNAKRKTSQTTLPRRGGADDETTSNIYAMPAARRAPPPV